MGKRGPRPQPTAMKKLKGNPGKRKLDPEEPQPKSSVPAPPEWLLPAALAEWTRMLPELERLGLLTGADWGAFAGYCQNFARWQEAEAWMRANGTVMTLRNDKGEVKWTQPVPQFAIAQKSLEKMLRYAQEFGLTPAARSGLKGSKPAEKPGGKLAAFAARGKSVAK